MNGVAIIGADTSPAHPPRLVAAARRADLDVVTAFSRDRDEAVRLGLPVAASLEAAIEDPRVEVVILATPNDVHAEQALACAQRGRHVFVEEVREWASATRGDAVVETGAPEGIAALRVILEAVGA